MIIYERPGMTDSIIDTLEKEKNARNWAGRSQEASSTLRFERVLYGRPEVVWLLTRASKTERLRDTSLLHKICSDGWPRYVLWQTSIDQANRLILETRKYESFMWKKKQNTKIKPKKQFSGVRRAWRHILARQSKTNKQSMYHATCSAYFFVNTRTVC